MASIDASLLLMVGSVLMDVPAVEGGGFETAHIQYKFDGVRKMAGIALVAREARQQREVGHISSHF